MTQGNGRTLQVKCQIGAAKNGPRDTPHLHGRKNGGNVLDGSEPRLFDGSDGPDQTISLIAWSSPGLRQGGFLTGAVCFWSSGSSGVRVRGCLPTT